MVKDDKKIIFNQADLFLAQSLDHEAAAEHQVTFDDDNDEVVIMIMIMMRRRRSIRHFR